MAKLNNYAKTLKNTINKNSKQKTDMNRLVFFYFLLMVITLILTLIASLVHSSVGFIPFVIGICVMFVLPIIAILLRFAEHNLGAIGIITNLCLGFMLLGIYFLMIKK